MASVGSSQTMSDIQAEKGTRRIWTSTEEAQLIYALKDLCIASLKCPNGIFRLGYLQMLEHKLGNTLESTMLRATPHIESKIKMWKR